MLSSCAWLRVHRSLACHKLHFFYHTTIAPKGRRVCAESTNPRLYHDLDYSSFYFRTRGRPWATLPKTPTTPSPQQTKKESQTALPIRRAFFGANLTTSFDDLRTINFSTKILRAQRPWTAQRLRACCNSVSNYASLGRAFCFSVSESLKILGLTLLTDNYPALENL